MDDGVLETILVKNVPKRTFARLFPAYSAGEYWKFPHIARMVTSRQVVITASPGEADIVTCLDGESLRSREVRLVLAEKRVNFFGPKGCSPNATARYDAITPVEVPVLGGKSIMTVEFSCPAGQLPCAPLLRGRFFRNSQILHRYPLYKWKTLRYDSSVSTRMI